MAKEVILPQKNVDKVFSTPVSRKYYNGQTIIIRRVNFRNPYSFLLLWISGLSERKVFFLVLHKNPIEV